MRKIRKIESNMPSVQKIVCIWAEKCHFIQQTVLDRSR